VDAADLVLEKNAATYYLPLRTGLNTITYKYVSYLFFLRFETIFCRSTKLLSIRDDEGVENYRFAMKALGEKRNGTKSPKSGKTIKWKIKCRRKI